MTDAANQLALLRAQRDATADPALRAALDAAIAALEATAARSITTSGGDYAEGGVDKRVGTFVGGVVGPLHQHFYNGAASDPAPLPPPPFVAAEVSQLRQQALVAVYRQQWIEAADLLAQLVERDPADAAAAAQLDEIRGNLRLHDRYAVAQRLQQAGEWQATLGALTDITHVDPTYPDPDGLRAWAEAEYQRAIWKPRFGPVAPEVAAGKYREAVQLLTLLLATHPADAASLHATTQLLEAGGLSIPTQVRLDCGKLLAQYGDPRPGVCSLPPAMVPINGGSFVIGMTSAEFERLPKTDVESLASSVNHAPLMITDFAIGRYPVTNAQYQQFIAAGGYAQQAVWWDDSARAWLERNDATIPDLEPWHRRQYKHQPAYWLHQDFGIARPNHPVVGVSWYEATTFCRWLTQHLDDGFTYLLPSEAEWEYAARGIERRSYPWGDQAPDRKRANFDETYKATTPVGCFPQGATHEGVQDLAGNVWEWTRSEYRPYPYNPDDGRESGYELDKKALAVRGGSWNVRSLSLHAAFRRHFAPDFSLSLVGFRLARHAQKGA